MHLGDLAQIRHEALDQPLALAWVHRELSGHGCPRRFRPHRERGELDQLDALVGEHLGAHEPRREFPDIGALAVFA